MNLSVNIHKYMEYRKYMSDFKVTQRMWNDLILGHNKLVDRVKKLEGAPLPSSPTPPCPACGSTRVRIVYKDDEATEVDFYDCTMCSTIFLPTKNIPPNRNQVKHLCEGKDDE